MSEIETLAEEEKRLFTRMVAAREIADEAIAAWLLAHLKLAQKRSNIITDEIRQRPN